MKPFIVQKILNEGTSEPFFARMMCQNLELRDFVINGEEQKKEFDELYEPLLNNLIECRQAMKECIKLITEHSQKINSGMIISGQEKAWTIKESVDKDLNRNFKDFFIKGRIALQCLDKLSKYMGFSIGFFFQKDKNFDEQVKTIADQNKDQKYQGFLEMLKNDRAIWYTLFRNIRVEIEHSGFNLPATKYNIDSTGKGQALFPTVDNKSIIDFLNLIWGNLFEFCEDVFVHLVDLKLTPPAIMTHIPESKRNPEMPIKYRIEANVGS